MYGRALKLGCITNADMLFLTNEFICLFYENKFMLISAIFRIGLLDSSKRITTCTTISVLSLNFSIFSSVNFMLISGGHILNRSMAVHFPFNEQQLQEL